MTTGKIIDNYSRHQTRLHRIYKDLTERLDDLLAQRDPDDNRTGFVSQKESRFALQRQNTNKDNPTQEPNRSFTPESGLGSDPQESPGFASQHNSGPFPETDPSFARQKSPSAKPQPPHSPIPNHGKHKKLKEIGFVLQNRKPQSGPHQEKPAA